MRAADLPSRRAVSRPRASWQPVSSSAQWEVAPAPRRRLPGKRGRAGSAASLVRGSVVLQPVLEAPVEIGVDRQVVGQELRVELDDFGQALLLLTAVDAGDSNDDLRRRQKHSRRDASPTTAIIA